MVKYHGKNTTIQHVYTSYHDNGKVHYHCMKCSSTIYPTPCHSNTAQVVIAMKACIWRNAFKSYRGIPWCDSMVLNVPRRLWYLRFVTSWYTMVHLWYNMCTMVYHGMTIWYQFVPWYLLLSCCGIPWYICVVPQLYHGLPWYTMVIPW